MSDARVQVEQRKPNVSRETAASPGCYRKALGASNALALFLIELRHVTSDLRLANLVALTSARVLRRPARSNSERAVHPMRCRDRDGDADGTSRPRSLAPARP